MNKLLQPAAGLLLLASFAAHADDASFYVGAGIGHVSVSRGSLSLSGGNQSGIDGGGTAASLALGGWFPDNLGVELAYHDYGHPAAFQQSGLTAVNCPATFSCPKLSGISAEGLVRLELVPQLDGVLRAGLLQWQVGSPGGMLLGKSSGSAFIYGIGVTRHFDYAVNLDIIYEHSSFSTGETHIGLSYSF